MSTLTQGLRPLTAGLSARMGCGRIATAHLLESDFHDNVDAAVERVDTLCSMTCARLSAEAVALEARLWAMADTVPSQILRHEAGTGAARLEAAGNAALEEIQILAVELSLRTQETAGQTADALRGSSGAESSLAATVVLNAADDASTTLRRISTAAFRDIQAALGNACRRIEAIAGQSEVQRTEIE